MSKSAESTKKRFIRLPEVSSRTGLPRASVYEAMDAGTFPKSIRLGEITVAWLESEIDAWIEQRIAASRQAGGAQ